MPGSLLTDQDYYFEGKRTIEIEDSVAEIYEEHIRPGLRYDFPDDRMIVCG